MKDKYRYVGPIYDAISSVYGGQAIHNSKKAMIESHVKPGDKVLIAGAGHGKDAIRACELGAEVTVVELSPTMVSALQNKLDKQGLTARVVQGDIMEFDEFYEFDMVVANFFLNVFPEEFMLKLSDHLIDLVKPDGAFVVGDFIQIGGNPLLRLIQLVNWYFAAILFFFISGNAVHAVYDYKGIMEARGLEIKGEQVLKHLGLPLYASILGRKSK